METVRNAFEGRLVRLRAVEPSDWEAHFVWNMNTEAARLMDRVGWPDSREAVRRWAEQAAVQNPADHNQTLQIETLAGGLVGTLNTHTCDPRCGTFMYGVAIQPGHQRKGYASEAVLLLLRHMFGELRYQKCTVTIYSFNEASIRLHERLGFRQEGRLRRMVYTRGQYHDHLLYGITGEEFEAQWAAQPAPSSE